jgi:cell wall-associated NlpC family hydrolase
MSARMANNVSDMAAQGKLIQSEDGLKDKSKTEKGTAAQECTAGECTTCEELTTDEREKLMKIASECEGTPYAPLSDNVHRGNGAAKGATGGADCSGSVWAIYAEAGFSYPYAPTASFPSLASKGLFIKISDAEVQPGDIIYWPPISSENTRSAGHMMLYLSGAGQEMKALGARRTKTNFSEYPAKWFDSGRTRQFYRYCKR